jgi:hypothetical protein
MQRRVVFRQTTLKKRLRRNRNRDSCGKSAPGTENTGIRRIPAGICNLALVAASATTSPPPPSSLPPVDALRTSILAKNAAAALLLLASARDVVSDGGRGGRHEHDMIDT